MSASTPSCERQKVLLIDDDELIAGSLRQYLISQGCDVDVATEPRAAEDLMGERCYDVVMVDPYLTGGILREEDALVTAIRALQPSASLIILTGYASPALALIAGRERATALLTKPQSILFLGQFVAGASQSAASRALSQPLTFIP
jgi:two-component system response regulator RegA